MTAALAIGAYFYLHLGDEIRARVEQRLNDHYRPLGIQATVRSAQLIEGQGIEIRGLTLLKTNEAGRPAPLVEIDELLLACDANIKDLVQNKLQIRQILVRHPKLTATREPNGTWDVERLMPLPKFSGARPSISIESGSVQLLDPTRANARPFLIREGQVRLQWINPAAPPASSVAGSHNSPAVGSTTAAAVSANTANGSTPSDSSNSGLQLACEATGTSELIEKISLRGLLDPASGRWNCLGTVEGISVSPEFTASLPVALPKSALGIDNLRAQGALRFELHGDPAQTPPIRAGVDCTLTRGQLDDPRLPFPLVDVEAQIRLIDEVATLDRLTARHGQTTLHVTGERRGLADNSPLNLVLKVRKLILSRDTVRQLPVEMQAQWQKYLPSGELDVDVWLAFDGKTWTPDVTARLVNLAFSFYKFPYRVDQAVGTLSYTGGQIGLDINAQAGEGPVHIVGRIAQPGPDWTGLVEIAGTNLTIDDRLLFALPEKGREVVRKLNPAGTFDVAWKTWREDPKEEKPHSQMTMALRECSIKYEKFPYPLTGIRGNIDLLDNHWTFRDLEGSNDTGFVTCRGELVPVEGGPETRLALHFAATGVPLDVELRDALPAGARKVWNDLKPQGNIDLTADTVYLSAEKQLDQRIVVQPVEESVSCEPVQFPYKLEKIAGSFLYHNGVAQWSNARAEHGRTQVTTSGYAQPLENHGWKLQLTGLNVDRLQPDRDLLIALPSGLRHALTRLNPTGQFRTSGNYTLQRPAEDKPLQSQWDVTVTMGQASLDCGVKLTGVNGDMQFTGASDGQNFQTRGELFLDSLMYENIQLTELYGPLLVDNVRILLGAWVEQQLGLQQPGKPLRSLTAKLYGGTLVGDGWVALGERPRYSFSTALTDANLALLAQETLPGVQNLKGFASAAVEIHGTGPGTNLLAGGGNVSLRETDIGELPVMVQLLKVLRARTPNATAFNASEMSFRIEGEHLYFDKLNLLGDAFSLDGKGEVDFQRNVKLWFNTVLGRNDLGFTALRKLMGEASGQILQVRVNGTLSEPEITTDVLPAVNKALQQLQADLGGGSGTSSAQGGNPIPQGAQRR